MGIYLRPTYLERKFRRWINHLDNQNRTVWFFFYRVIFDNPVHYSKVKNRHYFATLLNIRVAHDCVFIFLMNCIGLNRQACVFKRVHLMLREPSFTLFLHIHVLFILHVDKNWRFWTTYLSCPLRDLKTPKENFFWMTPGPIQTCPDIFGR